VRSAVNPLEPGPNYFSDSPDHLWVDSEGRLHLRAAPAPDGRWYCAEVELALSPGYGMYQFTVDSPLDDLDPNIAFGMFTWSDDPAENHRELDIEFAVFGQPTPLSGRYTLQPYTNADNVYLFRPPTTSSSVHQFTWTAQRVAFESYATGATQPVAAHTFVRNVPDAGGERVHMNLWLDAGQPPTNGQPVEIVVRAFRFTPPN